MNTGNSCLYIVPLISILPVLNFCLIKLKTNLSCCPLLSISLFSPSSRSIPSGLGSTAGLVQDPGDIASCIYTITTWCQLYLDLDLVSKLPATTASALPCLYCICNY